MRKEGSTEISAKGSSGCLVLGQPVAQHKLEIDCWAPHTTYSVDLANTVVDGWHCVTLVNTDQAG